MGLAYQAGGAALAEGKAGEENEKGLQAWE